MVPGMLRALGSGVRYRTLHRNALSCRSQGVMMATDAFNASPESTFIVSFEASVADGN